jgi:hypothetical protein
MVDTIVIHHSETPVTDSPYKINEYHLSRGTAEDPWLMIAYSFVVNSPYPGIDIPRAAVTEGRPLEIVGAHAGSNVFAPMDENQKKMYDDGKITCGNGDDFKVDPNMVVDGKIKANVTTIGVVVVGNYAPFSAENPGGFPEDKPLHPSAATVDLLARTACQLQKQYPGVKSIKWHNYYHETTCPGTIAEHISKIIELAGKYGCEFK